MRECVFSATLISILDMDSVNQNKMDFVFVGVEPNAGQQAYAYAALDSQLRLIAIKDCELAELLEFLDSNPTTTIAINSPSDVNHGVIREKLKQEQIQPHQIRGADLRVAEFELRKLGVQVTGTPAHIGLCPTWMQSGFEIYRNLKELGYQAINSTPFEHQFLETNPQASFFSLIGSNPLSKPTMEGRLQRQLILHECGIQIKDPMDFFEEITRYKIINGSLPIQLIYPPEYLDALVGAYTAWCWIHDHQHIQILGSQEEGRIVLPGSLSTKRQVSVRTP